MTSISALNNIYIRQSGSDIQYNVDNGNWNTISSWPLTISNTNSSGNVLPILFTTDITFNSVDQYFVCGSRDLQFGSTSLNSNGSRPTININVNDYPGLIQNGTILGDGQNNIYIYNLIVNGHGYTLGSDAGWVCQSYFCKNSNQNYIVNCSSTGDMSGTSTGTGGIVGAYAASNNGSLFIIGCNSLGNISDNSGGIVGGEACQNNGNISCLKCFSSGSIGDYSGGILGSVSGDINGNAIAINCYSLGEIANSGGGIFGSAAGGTSGNVVATNCYSRGDIFKSGGGIFGPYAGNSSAIINVTNCYSSGLLVDDPNNGIYGSASSGNTPVNCYVANGSWLDSNALSSLTGASDITKKIGSTWLKRSTNKPFELVDIGYSPYQQQTIINTGAPSLNTIFGTTVNAGDSTISAIVPNQSYANIDIIGNFPSSFGSITINPNTGVISTLSSTEAGTYTIYVYNSGNYSGSYHSTIVNLTVNRSGPPPPPPQPGGPSISGLVKGSLGITSSVVTDLKGAFAMTGAQYQKPLRFTSIDQYIKYKKAIAKRLA